MLQQSNVLVSGFLTKIKQGINSSTMFFLSPNCNRVMVGTKFSSVHSIHLQADLVINDYVYVIPKSVSAGPCTYVIGQILDIRTQDEITQEELAGFDKAHWDAIIGCKYTMALVRVWEVVDQTIEGFIWLDLASQDSLKDIDEFAQSQKALWCCGGEITDVAYIFQKSDLDSSYYPSLNGVQNFSMLATRKMG